MVAQGLKYKGYSMKASYYYQSIPSHIVCVVKLGYLKSGFLTSFPMLFSLHQRLKNIGLFYQEGIWISLKLNHSRTINFLWFWKSTVRMNLLLRFWKGLVIHLLHLNIQFCQDSTYSLAQGIIFLSSEFSFLLDIQSIACVNLLWWLITIACLR